MPRSLFVWIAASCLLGFAGCSMCANTYDECGPTCGGGCGSTCGMEGRAGSLLSGGDPMIDSADFQSQAVLPRDKIASPRGPTQPTDKLAPIPSEGWKSSKAAGS